MFDILEGENNYNDRMIKVVYYNGVLSFYFIEIMFNTPSSDWMCGWCVQWSYKRNAMCETGVYDYSVKHESAFYYGMKKKCF